MKLSDIIEEFNQRYGIGMSAADVVRTASRIVAAVEDDELSLAAVASRNEGDFELPFDAKFDELMVEQAEEDTKYTERYFGDDDYRGRVRRLARLAAYRMIRQRHGLSDVA